MTARRQSKGRPASGRGRRTAKAPAAGKAAGGRKTSAARKGAAAGKKARKGGATRKAVGSGRATGARGKTGAASKVPRVSPTAPASKAPAASPAAVPDRGAAMRAEDTAARTARTRRIIGRLELDYPGARCSLDHQNPLHLLVATILSAQCTDERVNRVTPALFERYPEARAFAEADVEELENMIRSTGFFHNKARAIIGCCQELLMRHGGQVPADMESLVALPGIGRKTANVVLGNAYGIPGVVVDTHVTRLSERLGLTSQKDPNKIELDLMQVVPREKWTLLAHLFIEHGRKVCQARRPMCAECVLNDICSSSLV